MFFILLQIINSNNHSAKTIRLKKKLKILIVDDEEFVITYFKAALKKYQKEILTASTGIEAISICEKNPDIDLILMDIKIPKLDGYETTCRIREFNKDVFILAQTAYALQGDREKCLEVGCNDYMSKPIEKENLLQIIEKHF